MDRSTKTCIFLNGLAPTKKVIRKCVGENDTIICTDGAYDYMKAYQIKPDLLIGDMDSVSEIPQEDEIKVMHLRDPENNDLEKALNYCVKNDLREVRIFGADGKRMDHAIINLATLSSFSNLLNIEIISNEEYMCFLKPGEYGFSGKRGQRFSLLAIHTADELTVINARFPLNKETLHKGSRGLSNAFKTNDLHICFTTGSILFMTELRI